MKLGCSSWSYHAAFRAGRIDLRDWVRTCAADLDVDGIEFLDLHFPTTDPVYLRDLKKLCVDSQMTIAGLAVSNDFGPDDRRQLETAKVRQWCDVAAYVGAPVVRVFAGWVPRERPQADEGRVVGFFRKVLGPKQPDRRRIWSDVAWALRQCADYAADRGVVLALQNHAQDGIVSTPDQLAQLVRDVGSPWLRVCLEPADLVTRATLDTAMPRVVQVHARLRDVQPDGSDGTIHWPEILRSLRLGKYRGHILIDYEGLEDPELAVPRAARYLRGVLHLLQRQELLVEATADGPVVTQVTPDEPPAEIIEAGVVR
jgi:sugar phosphate isomerase/epimerase